MRSLLYCCIKFVVVKKTKVEQCDEGKCSPVQLGRYRPVHKRSEITAERSGSPSDQDYGIHLKPSGNRDSHMLGTQKAMGELIHNRHGLIFLIFLSLFFLKVKCICL